MSSGHSIDVYRIVPGKVTLVDTYFNGDFRETYDAYQNEYLHDDPDGTVILFRRTDGAIQFHAVETTKTLVGVRPNQEVVR
jgi:hypothetical protein